MCFVGVFHWGHLVSNYGFFKGREQCLQSQLGSVVFFRLVTVGRPTHVLFSGKTRSVRGLNQNESQFIATIV